MKWIIPTLALALWLPHAEDWWRWVALILLMTAVILMLRALGGPSEPEHKHEPQKWGRDGAAKRPSVSGSEGPPWERSER